MIDFLYNNLSIPSKTLPNIQKAQSEFGRSIEKTKKLLTQENPNKRRTTIAGLHHSLIVGETSSQVTSIC